MDHGDVNWTHICLDDWGKQWKEPQSVQSALGFELGTLWIQVQCDEFWSILCSVHSKIYHKPHFNIGRSWNKSLHLQPLQRYYCKNSGSLHHTTSLLYHIHAVASCNKWFTSCGMSGKLTVWTYLVLTLLYHIHTVTSHNKWFTSCGTSGKLTVWTYLVLTLLYHVHTVTSHNKWTTSCGTSGKLTVWTYLVSGLI